VKRRSHRTAGKATWAWALRRTPSGTRWTRGGIRNRQKPSSSRRSASRIALKPLESGGPELPRGGLDLGPDRPAFHSRACKCACAVRHGEGGRRVRVPCRWDGRRSETHFLFLFSCGEWFNALIQVLELKLWIFVSSVRLVCAHHVNIWQKW
jgi:hypothetical protein